MSHQHDSLTFGAENDKVIATCLCGIISHGALEFRIEPWRDKDGKDCKEWFLGFYASPAWNYGQNWFRRLRSRIRCAWAAWKGVPFEVDLNITDADAHNLARWLLSHPIGEDSWFKPWVRESTVRVQEVPAPPKTQKESA